GPGRRQRRSWRRPLSGNCDAIYSFSSKCPPHSVDGMWRSRAQRPRRIRYHNNNTKAALKQDPNRQKTSFSEKKGADIWQVRQKQEIDFTKKSRVQIVKKVPSSRHVRMDGTQPGKLSTESVRGPL